MKLDLYLLLALAAFIPVAPAAGLFNIKATSTADRPESPAIARDYGADKHQVSVHLGNTKQNIGDLIGSALYHVMYTAIWNICPNTTQSCHEKDTDAFNESIPVNYLAEDGCVKQTDLELFVRGGWYGNNDALRKLMIGTVAGVVEAMSKNEKNCFTFGDGLKHCNIGDYVHIEAPDGNYIKVYFTSKAKGGHFDCVAIKEAGLKSMQKLIGEYSAALGGGDMDMLIDCLHEQVTR